MITNETVLILGAGASQPFGFPTGQELVNEVFDALEYSYDTEWVEGDKSQSHGMISGIIHRGYNRDIIDDTRSSNILVDMLLRQGFEREFIEDFRQSLILSQLNSIDAFLEHRSEFITIGKMAMAYILLKYEKHKNVINQNSDWYRYLWNKLNSSYNSFEDNKLSIITFNYDRTFEYYLYNAFRNTYGKTEEETIRKTKKIEVLHLHGKLGYLAWENQLNATEFGEEITQRDVLLNVSNSIKIIHEDVGVSHSKEFERAFRLMDGANRIFFLGFGFSDTNLKRLRINELRDGIYMAATAYGMTETEVQILKGKTSDKITFDKYSKCLDFLRNQVLS